MYDNKNEYPEFNKLKSRRQKNFVWLYLQSSYKEKFFSMYTFNNALYSYIVAFNINCNEFAKVTKYSLVKNSSGYDELVVNNSIDNPDKIDVQITNDKIYQKIMKLSEMTYKICEKSINEIRRIEFKTNDETKQLEIINAIHKDALNDDDKKFKIENRKLAVDIYGLRQKEPVIKIDLYEEVGKRYVDNMLSSNNINKDLKNLVVSDNELNSITYDENDDNIKNKKELKQSITVLRKNGTYDSDEDLNEDDE